MKSTHITLLTLLLMAVALVLPAAAQDATPEVTVAADFQTYTAENDIASIQFPAGWVSESGNQSGDSFSLKVANQASALDKELFNPNDVFKPGEVHIEIAVILLDDLAKDLPDGAITTDATPMDILGALASQGMPDEFVFGEPGKFTIDGKPAVRMNLTAEKRGEGQLLLTVYDQKWVAALILYAAPGEGDKWDLIARDILGSVTFDPTSDPTPEPTAEATLEPLALTQTASTKNGLGALSYPINWYSRPYREQAIYIANTRTALNKSFGSELESGEVNILVTISSTQEFIDQASLSIEPDTAPLELLQATIASVSGDVQFDQPVAVTVGDKSAARVDYHSKVFEGSAWLIKYQNNAMIAVQLVTAPGEMQQWQPVALAIAESIRSTD